MPFTAPQKSPAPRHGVAGLSQLIKIMCGDASAVLLTAAFTMIEVYRNASGLMAGIMLLYLAVTIFVSRLQIRSQKGIRSSSSWTRARRTWTRPSRRGSWTT